MTDKALIDATYQLVQALDLPSDSPFSSAARLNVIAKNPDALAELVTCFVACETVVMGEKAEHAAPWRAKSLTKPHDKWLAVCFSFPSLEKNERARSAIISGNLRELEQLGRSAESGNGVKHAIRFALSIWNSGFDWECGRFDLIAALKAWDDAHRAAMREWLADPWWP